MVTDEAKLVGKITSFSTEGNNQTRFSKDSMIILIIVLVCLILLNPYIDVQQDKIIIWYNWFTERKHYILWRPQNS